MVDLYSQSWQTLDLNSFYYSQVALKILQYSYEALNNISDGDMGAKANVLVAYMKQKHRLIWERRHGPVGGAKKTPMEEEYYRKYGPDAEEQ